jgi:hypothetical protein
MLSEVRPLPMPEKTGTITEGKSMRVASRHRFVAGASGLLLLLLLLAVGKGSAATQDVTFVQSADEVERYDFVEVTATVPPPQAANPFTDVEVKGTFGLKGQPPVPVDGFCDSADGRVFRIRFMPARAGEYVYTVSIRLADDARTHAGIFHAREGNRRGPVRVDPAYPWHFVWEGTGEHYFWNGTTTYFLMGWKDEAVIRDAIDRLCRLKVNRIRVALTGRVDNGRAWYEDVYPGETFHFILNPWVAARPESVKDPGFDVTRFDVAYWQAWDQWR